MSAPVIAGVPTDCLKPSDLLWASLLDKPLLFPPNAHSHGSGDLPGNIAFKDQANTFTANQTVTGTITASGFASALKYQFATATVYGAASIERMAVNDYDPNYGIKIHIGTANKFTFHPDGVTGHFYSTEAKPRWGFRPYGTNEIGTGLLFSNSGVDVSLSGDYSSNLNVRNAAGALTGINAGNITASGTGTFGGDLTVSKANPKLTLNTSTTTSPTIEFVNSAKTFRWNMNSAGEFQLTDFTVGPTRLFIGSTGNIGIGDYYASSNLPQAKLSVAGAATIGFATSASVTVPSNGLAVNGGITASGQAIFRLSGGVSGTDEIQIVPVATSYIVGSQISSPNGALDVRQANGCYLHLGSSAGGGVVDVRDNLIALKQLSIGPQQVALTGTTPGIVNVAGGITASGAVTSSGLTTTAASSATVAAIVKGAAAQSVAIQEWQNSAGAVVASMYVNGTLIMGTLGASAIYALSSYAAARISYDGSPVGIGLDAYSASHQVRIKNNGATRTGLTVLGDVSQSANLQEWQNSAGTVLASVSPAGNLTATGTVTAGGFSDGSNGLGDNVFNVIRRDNSYNYFYLDSGGLREQSAGAISWYSGISIIGTRDLSISRNAANVLQIGTSTNNALGSLLLTNLTASGNVTVGNGSSTGAILKTHANGIELRNAADSAWGRMRAERIDFSAYSNWGDAYIAKVGDASVMINAAGSITQFRQGGGLQIDSGMQFGFCSASNNNSSVDIALGRKNSSGIEINNGTLGTLRDLLLMNLTASGTVTSAFQSLSTDPTGADLATGLTRIIKNTSSGTTKIWLNDGGTFKSLTFV